jgi:hypothetical protein
MDDMAGCGYKEMYMRQIVDARDAIFAEMCKELKTDNHHHVQRCFLNKPHITKDKLIRWLETVCFILDSNVVPLLDAGNEIIERVTELREEKIEDQETIIRLQQKVIEKSNENFQSVKNTVQEELKSYSSVLQRGCSNALSSKKLEAVIKKVSVTEEMSKNAIVYGLVETEHEKLLEKVEEVLAEIGEKPKLTNCTRVGTKREKVVRPVKITLNSVDHVNQILRNAKLLHTKVGYSGIYICPDRSVEQRKADKRLWEQLKAKRKQEPGKDHRIRNGGIVSSERDSKPSVSNSG